MVYNIIYFQFIFWHLIESVFVLIYCFRNSNLAIHYNMRNCESIEK